MDVWELWLDRADVCNQGSPALSGINHLKFLKKLMLARFVLNFSFFSVAVPYLKSYLQGLNMKCLQWPIFFSL